VEVLSSMSHWNLGAANIDVALYHHFMTTHPLLAQHPTTTTTTTTSTTSTPGGDGSGGGNNTLFACNSKRGQRLLEGCRKLKHMLSMLPSSTVTVENVGVDDCDVVLACTRDTLRELCDADEDGGGGVLQKLRSLIVSAMDKAGVKKVDDIEVTGGGCRIPIVQDVIRSVCKKEGEYALGQSLDDTALAFGASSLGVGIVNENDDGTKRIDGGGRAADDIMKMMDATRVARREQLRELENVMAAQDGQYQRKAEIKNCIEAHILELRSARHDSKFGSLLPSSNKEFTSHLDETDDWLFSEACDAATVKEMEERWVAIQSKTKELCADYLDAKQAEIDKKNREMEEEVQRAAALREAEYAMNGGTDDMEEQEDHDTRRLPTKRRMNIVLKNKTEANELFAGGNYRHAAARYVKALTHCGKFFDLSPVEEREVMETKLSLYLNVALAYIKLEKLDNAYQYCNDALSLDTNNVKALYRRASVLYQKRKFDDAMRDCVEAENLAPDDKAVKKLKALLEQQIAKQKKKEKAMAKKMFG
jgi:tetratricopeptide (TPR) repeat protein